MPGKRVECERRAAAFSVWRVTRVCREAAFSRELLAETSKRQLAGVGSFYAAHVSSQVNPFNPSLCFLMFPLQTLVSNHSESFAKLKLSNVTETDAGKYWCRASNFVGKSEKAFWLKVHNAGKGPECQPPSPTSSAAPPLLSALGVIGSLMGRAHTLPVFTCG